MSVDPHFPRIGLLGGMSWASTATYFDAINRRVLAATGGRHAADMVVRCYDTTLVEAMIAREEWPQMAAILDEDAERMDADVLAIASNTVHRAAPLMEHRVLHVVDAVRPYLISGGSALLLGTGSLIAGGVYAAVPGLTMPSQVLCALVDEVVYTRLCRGLDPTPEQLESLNEEISRASCQDLILGCTELGLVPSLGMFSAVVDTALAHALAIADEAVRIWRTRVDDREDRSPA